MTGMRADRIFFYLLLLLVFIVTLLLIRDYVGSVVLAIIVAVVLQPVRGWFMRRTGDRKGLSTALTMLATFFLVVIPVLVGAWLLFSSLVALSDDVERAMLEQQPILMQRIEALERRLEATEVGQRLGIESGDIEDSLRDLETEAGKAILSLLAEFGRSLADLVLPTIVFISLLGTLLANSETAIGMLKDLSPLDDDIDQLFLDRLRIMTRSMMLSIVVVAVAQGLVTGVLMALGGTPHIIPLTVSAMIMSILPGGAAIIAIPIGIVQLLFGNTWSGVIIIAGTLTLVSAVANQVRPMMVSKEAYLNRAFILLSVFSGLAAFGYMGVVYGPLIMILFTTVIEVYRAYFRPGAPTVTLADDANLPGPDRRVDEN